MRQLTLPNGKVITLNSQQNEALDYMTEKWLRDTEDFIFVLSGYAGTGKTTIVKEAIRYYTEEMFRTKHEVAVTAPTHKAKKVISDATGFEGKTVQNILGLQPNVDVADFDINNPAFAVRKKPTIEDYSLIIIDEASMFNLDLFTMIVKEATRNRTKLLFMCDEAQLPPVKELISPVITSDLVKYRYQLTKVERQSDDNPVMKIYDAIRSNLSSSVDAFLPKTKINKETGEGITFHETLDSFGKKAVALFGSDEFLKDANHCKILCWTNARVRFWNKAIRNSIIQRLPEEERLGKGVLMRGELLMGYQSYREGIENSAEYIVTGLVHGTTKIKYGSRGALSVEVTGYKIVLMDVDENHKTAEAFIVSHNPENLVKFLLAFDYYLEEAKFNRKWPQYFKFKSKYMLIQDIVKGGRLVIKKDLDYSYAITIHKSQGSTYKNILMDMPDVNKNLDYEERNKLKYVALSRLSSHAYVLAT